MGLPVGAVLLPRPEFSGKNRIDGYSEDISTLLPSLKRYERKTATANQFLRERLQNMSLNALQKETGLSRNTILRARRGERVHPRSKSAQVRALYEALKRQE